VLNITRLFSFTFSNGTFIDRAILTSPSLNRRDFSNF